MATQEQTTTKTTTQQRERPRLKRLLLWVVVPLALGILLPQTNYWKSSPLYSLQHRLAYSSPYYFSFLVPAFTRRTSVEGRIPVGYWDDTATSGETSLAQSIDKAWEQDEQQMVMAYLERAFSSSSDDDTDNDLPTIVMVWRGLANCRVCEEILGNTCHGDFRYNWPESYLHYIQKHHVKPPQHFIDHARRQMAILTNAA